MSRHRLQVNGIVQGVGFRPFVVRTANALNLGGHVCNTSEGVVIEVEGDDDHLAEFARRLRHDAPPLARVVSVAQQDITAVGATEFVIRPSADSPGTSTLIPPDAATCADCLREVRDPADRRHGYPFTNCTNCGPRWTIMDRIPYDRPQTSMAAFTMCPACQAEYDDVGDRRFHAQPNACPVCGPQIRVVGPLGATDRTGGPLAQAAEALARHAVVAIRGLGGFQLAVRADVSAPVQALRHRKRRAAKPLALMVPDLATADRLAFLSPAEREILASPAAPIVLVNRRDTAAIAPEVAPGHRRLGLMLPTTPLHHLLFDALKEHGISALVMTSGNVSEEPICLDNDEALQKLSNLADAFVLHDREIRRRADDSVMQVVRDRPVVLRRGRGLAPVPVFLPDTEICEPILAVGPQLKNTVCLLKEGRAFVSPHVGDLGQLETDQFFAETIDTLQGVLECEPRIVAHDLHPGYTSTIWAQQQKQRHPERQLIPVQHHHAHLAAVLAEHQVPGPAVGLIMDGTGYGPDGTIWGGEVLVGDALAFERVAHFEPVPLPGGEAAIRAPWRQAVSYLRHTFGPDFFTTNPPGLEFQHDRPLGPVLKMLDRNVNCPLTSSCGRLFDAVAAIIGPWTDVGYEAQAAIELTALTTPSAALSSPPFAEAMTELAKRIASHTAGAGPLQLPIAPIVRSACAFSSGGIARSAISAVFHRTVIETMATVAEWAATRSGLQDVVLGGGVFQNEILLEGVPRRLEQMGLRVWVPRDVPCGDGGISLGQAAVAAAQIKATGRRPV